MPVHSPIDLAAVLPQLAAPFSPMALAGVVGCLVVAAFGATVGTALLLHSPTKLARRFGDDEAKLARLRRVEPDLVVTARVLSVLGGAGACLAALAVGGSLPAWGAVCLAAVALVGVCGALPPALATTRAETIVAHGWPALDLVRGVLRWPLLLPARAFARVVLHILRIPRQPTEDAQEIAEDILDAVADNDPDNALEPEEKTWIANIVDLKDLSVSAIMTPRTDVIALPADQDLAAALQSLVATGHSRYPVHAGRIDEIVGLLYAKDVLALVSAGEALAERRVRDLMRKPVFVPQTMDVPGLLHELKQAKVHLAIVLDEYGGTAGLITVDDVLEEIVGDLADEFGDDEEEPLQVIEERVVLETSGRVRVAEVNAALPDVDLPVHGDYDTLAGYLFSRLARIPRLNEKVELDGVEFTVLRGDLRRIDRLRLRVLQPQRSDSAV